MENITMTNDCKTCPVSTGTHKPAEAVHQIAEPAAALTEQDATLLNQGIELLFAISNDERNSGNCSTAEGAAASAYAVQRLTSTLLTTQRAAPQAVQAAVPLFWVRLLRDGLYEGPVHNNSVGGKMLRDEKPGEWHPLYLHAAPAHPAGGVPAAKNGRQVLVDSGALQMVLNALERDALEGKQVRAAMRLELMQSIATHPTQQGLDSAQKTEVIEHGDCMRVCVIENDGTSLIVPASDFQNHIAEIADLEEPDMDDEVSYTLTFKSMPRADVDALPEFNGF